jgi:hypothetical protein
MSTGHRFLTDYGKALGPGGNHTILAPSSGGTFEQKGMAYGTATVGAGTYILPDDGLPMIVRATGAVVINSEASVMVTTLADGQAAIFLPLTSTTWSAVILDTGASASLKELEATLTTQYGYIYIPLTSWREVVSNDVAALATAGTTGSGGVLATDTTPTLEYVNGDTDSTLRMLWATSNVDPIVTQVMLPSDCDISAGIAFKAAGLMSGSSNAPVLSLDTYFYAGAAVVTAKVEDDTTAFGPALSTVTASIATGDIPSTAAGVPVFATIEVTPGAHATDTLQITGTWIQYTKKLLTA